MRRLTKFGGFVERFRFQPAGAGHIGHRHQRAIEKKPWPPGHSSKNCVRKLFRVSRAAPVSFAPERVALEMAT